MTASPGTSSPTSAARPSPYLFSPEELRQLLEATARLRPRGSLRPTHLLHPLRTAGGHRLAHLGGDALAAE